MNLIQDQGIPNDAGGFQGLPGCLHELEDAFLCQVKKGCT